MRLKDRKINVILPAGWFYKCVGATRNDVSVRFVSFCLTIAGLHLASNLENLISISILETVAVVKRISRQQLGLFLPGNMAW